MATCPTCRTRYPDGTDVCAKDGETLLADVAFQSADADLAPGQTVGEYQIKEKIGEGGFGAVYRAVHPLIGKTAAVKVLNRQYSSNPQMVSRFIAEARAVNQIRHRNIIDIFAFGGLPDGRQYFIMELLEGMPFDRYLDQRGHLPVGEAIPILRSVAKALDAAHQAGIAHRDIKPENVFLSMDDGQIFPKLLDFGIAKLLTDAGQSGQSAKTRTGTPMGTPNYMSPEQCRGKNVDHRTDVYSFGVLTHKVLTGKLPFDGEDVVDILVKQTTHPAPPMSTVASHIPPSLDKPVLHMLEKDAAARPLSLTSAIDELVSAAQTAGVSVQHTPGWLPQMRQADSARVAVTPHLTPDQANQLASARTAVQQVGNSTQLTSESRSIEPASPKRPAIWMVIASVAAVAVVAGGLLMIRKDPAPLPAATAPASATATLPARDTQAASAAAPATSTPMVVAPLASAATVDITVQSTPAKADVYLAGEKLGPAPGPFHLKRGDAKVKLTLKADGYIPKDVELVPSVSDSVTVTMSKPAAKPKGELENPF